MNIKFSTSKAEVLKISKIAARAVKLAADHGVEYKQIDACMDIEATHCNGCPLDLDALLAADDFNVAHDTFGIRRHLDRTTGELGDHFIPRFARVGQAA